MTSLIAIIPWIFVALVIAVGTVIHRRLRPAGKVKPLPRNLYVTSEANDFTVADKKNMKTVIIRWADISRVTVITTDQGPFVDDVFYHIVHLNGELTLPSEANGMPAFVDTLSTLPGFNAPAHTAAMASADNNSFSVILSKPSEEAPTPSHAQS